MCRVARPGPCTAAALATPRAPTHAPLTPLPQVERAVEYMKERGLVGAARDAADEVLVRRGGRG